MSILQSALDVRRSTSMRFFLLFIAASAFAQSDTDAVRVNMTINPDGSRTTYRFDGANHKATAVTTDSGGNATGKTIYRIDDQGRFGSGITFDGKDKFRFKSLYKYDGAGRIQEETQLNKDDAILYRLVYGYDANGHQTGYSVFDATGKLLGQTSAAPMPPPPMPAKKK